MLIKQNQEHPTPPKRKRVDAQGNHRKKMYYKDGTSTMLFCEGVTENAAKALDKRIRAYAEALGTKIKGTFLITN